MFSNRKEVASPVYPFMLDHFAFIGCGTSTSNDCGIKQFQIGTTFQHVSYLLMRLSTKFYCLNKLCIFNSLARSLCSVLRFIWFSETFFFLLLLSTLPVFPTSCLRTRRTSTISRYSTGPTQCVRLSRCNNRAHFSYGSRIRRRQKSRDKTW